METSTFLAKRHGEGKEVEQQWRYGSARRSGLSFVEKDVEMEGQEKENKNIISK